MKDDQAYLTHIMQAISKIEEYATGVNKEKFKTQSLIQDGIIRQIEIIGEATKNISNKTKEKHPRIPWKDIAGMRDKLVHHYFGVDIDAVWKTVKKDIPALKKQLRKVAKS
jgi:uncharacterized protein with HEPN domain